MAKPWAKYEIDYINHDKFRAINANAICLWHEGKNYCDLRLTDGLIPEATAKHFRFYSKKTVLMLTTSCGVKPGTSDTYAPLWELVESFGFKMHDYLDHNDCREKVQERLTKYEEDKKRKAENLKAWRDRQRSETAPETACEAGMKPAVKPEMKPVSPVSNQVSETAQTIVKPDKQKQLQKQQQHTETVEEQKRAVSARSGRVIFDGQKIVVFEWMLDNCLKTLGNLVDQFDLHEWFFQLDAEALAANLLVPKRDGGAWLDSRLIAEVQRRGLPLQIASAETAPTNKRIEALMRGGQKFLERSTQ